MINSKEIQRKFLKNWFDGLCFRTFGPGPIETVQSRREMYDDLFSKLETAYSAPQRTYHNLDHIEQMYAVFVDVWNLDSLAAKDPVAIEWAMWFHDVIQRIDFKDPTQSSEQSVEQLSANFAEMYLGKLGATTKLIGKVKNMILLTQNHIEASKKSLTNDEMLFLDLDMSILGTQARIYQKYAQNVRKEYSFLPDSAWQHGRSQFIENVLTNIPFLFKTQIMQNKFKMTAMANLELELALFFTDYKKEF